MHAACVSQHHSSAGLETDHARHVSPVLHSLLYCSCCFHFLIKQTPKQPPIRQGTMANHVVHPHAADAAMHPNQYCCRTWCKIHAAPFLLFKQPCLAQVDTPKTGKWRMNRLGCSACRPLQQHAQQAITRDGAMQHASTAAARPELLNCMFTVPAQRLAQQQPVLQSC